MALQRYSVILNVNITLEFSLLFPYLNSSSLILLVPHPLLIIRLRSFTFHSTNTLKFFTAKGHVLGVRRAINPTVSNFILSAFDVKGLLLENK